MESPFSLDTSVYLGEGTRQEGLLSKAEKLKPWSRLGMLGAQALYLARMEVRERLPMLPSPVT